jgi:hypothetical protein
MGWDYFKNIFEENWQKVGVFALVYASNGS